MTTTISNDLYVLFDEDMADNSEVQLILTQPMAMSGGGGGGS